jgi:acid phosphatase
MRWRSAVILGCLLPLGACQSGPGARAPYAGAAPENLNASLWMQSAAEYVASAEQAYRLATVQLDEALKPENAAWTADPEQVENYTHLPPAVVLDVDDAVLATSAFQARIVTELGQFQPEAWNEWAQRAEAPAIPGALEFTRHAVARGVHVFYLTNRNYEVEDATRRNLDRLGFRVDPDGSNLLTKGEDPDWDSEKVERRALIASKYRVLLMVGDDMNDFVAGGRTTPQGRVELANRYRSYWGTKWILLPNPAYGDWERSHYGFEEGLSADEKRRRKLDALESGP